MKIPNPLKRLMRESTVRPIKRILFRTMNDFLAFEEVDEEIYNDLVRILSKYTECP